MDNYALFLLPPLDSDMLPTRRARPPRASLTAPPPPPHLRDARCVLARTKNSPKRVTAELLRATMATQRRRGDLKHHLAAIEFAFNVLLLLRLSIALGIAGNFTADELASSRPRRCCRLGEVGRKTELMKRTAGRRGRRRQRPDLEAPTTTARRGGVKEGQEA